MADKCQIVKKEDEYYFKVSANPNQYYVEGFNTQYNNIKYVKINDVLQDEIGSFINTNIQPLKEKNPYEKEYEFICNEINNLDENFYISNYKLQTLVNNELAEINKKKEIEKFKWLDGLKIEDYTEQQDVEPKNGTSYGHFLGNVFDALGMKYVFTEGSLSNLDGKDILIKVENSSLDNYAILVHDIFSASKDKESLKGFCEKNNINSADALKNYITDKVKEFTLKVKEEEIKNKGVPSGFEFFKVNLSNQGKERKEIYLYRGYDNFYQGTVLEVKKGEKSKEIKIRPANNNEKSSEFTYQVARASSWTKKTKQQTNVDKNNTKLVQ